METTATPRRRDADVRSRRRRYAPPDYAHRGHFWWVAQLIGWLFRPKPDILKAVDEAMAVLPKGEPFVGLHVRHGDKCRGERPDGPSVGDPSSFLNLDDTGRPEDHRIECGSFTEYMIHARYAASAKPRGQVAATPRPGTWLGRGDDDGTGRIARTESRRRRPSAGRGGAATPKQVQRLHDLYGVKNVWLATDDADVAGGPSGMLAAPLPLLRPPEQRPTLQKLKTTTPAVQRCKNLIGDGLRRRSTARRATRATRISTFTS